MTWCRPSGGAPEAPAIARFSQRVLSKGTTSAARACIGAASPGNARLRVAAERVARIARDAEQQLGERERRWLAADAECCPSHMRFHKDPAWALVLMLAVVYASLSLSLSIYICIYLYIYV